MELNNYEYIIASLPVLQQGYDGALDTGAVAEEIRSGLSQKDAAALSFLSAGLEGSALGEQFYKDAAASRNSFIRDYFAYDLGLRNAKAAYLNKALGRPEGKDLLPSAEEFEDAAKAQEVLSNTDILARERGIDDLLWAKAEELTQMHIFALDVILAFVVKLHIVGRWLALDEQRGRELFRKMVKDIKETANSK